MSYLISDLAFPKNANDINLEKLQAAFILKFTNYIEWPARKSPFAIAVLNNPELYNSMKEVFEGKTINEQVVTLIHLDKLEHKRDKNINFNIICIKHINSALAKELSQLGTSGLLTITQDPNGPNEHTVINFYVTDEGKLRFDIDNSKAESHQLKINSRLLNLARNSK